MTLYHGTRRGFTKGGVVMPVDFHRGEARSGHQGEDSTKYAYATSDRDQAVDYALQAKGRGRPKVLIVHPIGTLELDPSTWDGEQGVQYRASAFMVEKVEYVSEEDQTEYEEASR